MGSCVKEGIDSCSRTNVHVLVNDHRQEFMTESTDYTSISHRFFIDVSESYAWMRANVESPRALVESSAKTTLTPSIFF